MAARVVWNDRAVDRMFNSEDGPVGTHILALGYQVEAEAKSLASGPMVKVQTGRLAGSITTQRVLIGGVPAVIVGTNVEYAPYVFGGTRPHTIVPRKAKVLRFTGRGGGVVFARRVNHPGTKPRPVLETALRNVIR